MNVVFTKKRKRGRPKNITVPFVKKREALPPKSPYGHIKVVSAKSQKIKPTTKIKKVIATSGGTQVKPPLKLGRVKVISRSLIKPKKLGRVIKVKSGGTPVKLKKLERLRVHTKK